MTTLLGIGSRIRHDEFGNGVVINLKANGYIVTFHRSWREDTQIRRTPDDHRSSGAR